MHIHTQLPLYLCKVHHPHNPNPLHENPTIFQALLIPAAFYLATNLAYTGIPHSFGESVLQMPKGRAENNNKEHP